MVNTNSEIEFISTYEMYEKEFRGIKPFTMRDGRYFLKAKKCTHIRIRKGYTSTFFRRKITDVTLWDNKTLISWNPNLEQLQETYKRFKRRKESFLTGSKSGLFRGVPFNVIKEEFSKFGIK
jgi:hypothetical protein